MYSLCMQSDWLLSLCDMHLRLPRDVPWLDGSFRFSAEQRSAVWAAHRVFTHSPTEGHLRGFQKLAIMANAAISMQRGVCVDITFQLLWVNAEEHDRWIIWRERAEFPETPPGCLPGGRAVLHPHRRRATGPVAAHRHRHLVLSCSGFWPC